MTQERPDGGCLAWSIVAASSMVSFIQDGFIYSFGVMLPVLSKDFGVNKKEASLVNSLTTFMTLGSGLVVAGWTKKFGHRGVSVAGTLLAMAGLAAAGLYISLVNEPTIGIIYLCVGILTGFGFGMMYLPAMDIIEHYFSSRLNTASGIATAGSGLGQTVIAPLLQLIREGLSLTETFFCLVGLVAIALPFVLIYRTPKVPEREGADVEDDVVEGRCGSYSKLLHRPAVLFLLASYFLLGLGIFSAPAFTADRAEAGGMPSSTASYLLSIMGATNCLFRVLWGFVMDKFRCRTFSLAFTVFFINACSVLLGQLAPSLPGQLAYSALFGASFGAVMSCFPALNKNVGTDYARITALQMIVFGITSIAGPALVAALFDTTGSYMPGFLTVGVLGVLGAAILPLVQRHRPEDAESIACLHCQGGKIDPQVPPPSQLSTVCLQESPSPTPNSLDRLPSPTKSTSQHPSPSTQHQGPGIRLSSSQPARKGPLPPLNVTGQSDLQTTRC